MHTTYTTYCCRRIDNNINLQDFKLSQNGNTINCNFPDGLFETASVSESE